MRFRASGAPAWMSYFLLFSSFAILTPYLQLYLHARGFSPARIGALLGCFELAGIAGPVLVSRMADARSAYRGLLALCFVVPVLAFIPMEISERFAVNLACILLLGFSYRSTIPLLDSLVGRTLPDPAHQYGKLRVAGSVGFIVVSLVMQLSGLVTGDSSAAILVAFAMTAGAAAVGTALLPPAPAAPPLPPSARAPQEAQAAQL
jgi:PPP family 3-phenylpropionic acid transporter